MREAQEARPGLLRYPGGDLKPHPAKLRRRLTYQASPRSEGDSTLADMLYCRPTPAGWDSGHRPDEEHADPQLHVPVESPLTLRLTTFARLRAYFLTGLVITAPDRHHPVGSLVVRHLGRWPGEARCCRRPPTPTTICRWRYRASGSSSPFSASSSSARWPPTFFGRAVIRFWDRILNRMPVVRNIYKALKQIFETAVTPGGFSFHKVGLIEFPAPGTLVDRVCRPQPVARRRDRPENERRGHGGRITCRPRRTRPPATCAMCGSPNSSCSTCRSKMASRRPFRPGSSVLIRARQQAAATAARRDEKIVAEPQPAARRRTASSRSKR